MKVYPNRVKRQLAAGKLALGLVLRQARTVDTAAIAKSCGFDFISIDLEHSSLDIDGAAQLAVAALPLDIAPLVRLPSKEHHQAWRLLDAGAQGVIVPHVDTAAEARAVVAQCKYPPDGHRSFAAVVPQLAFQRLTGDEAARLVNAETLVVVMLETPAAIANAGAIAAVPGVDVLLIGTNDLCAEMGITGKFGDPRVADAYKTVADACRAQGKHAGMAGIHDPQLAAKFVGFGVRYIVGGVDVNFLMAAASERAKSLRGLLPD